MTPYGLRGLGLSALSTASATPEGKWTSITPVYSSTQMVLYPNEWLMLRLIRPFQPEIAIIATPLVPSAKHSDTAGPNSGGRVLRVADGREGETAGPLLRIAIVRRAAGDT